MNSNEETPSPEESNPEQVELTTSYRYYALGILTLVYVFNFIDRQILVILQESIKVELDLSDTQLGLLSGISFAIFLCDLRHPHCSMGR